MNTPVVSPDAIEGLFAGIDACVVRILELAAQCPPPYDGGERRALPDTNSLARANGRGLAGECPADPSAKTPATREGVPCLLAPASARGLTRGAIV